VHSLILTEVSDCGLLIVVISSTFLKGKDVLKGKKVVSPDHQNTQPSMYIYKCTLYTYTVYMYTALWSIWILPALQVSHTDSWVHNRVPHLCNVCVCVRMMMIAFITFKSSLVPLFEGL